MIDTGDVDKHYSGSYVAIGSNGQPYFKVHYQYIADTNLIQPGMDWNTDIDWSAVNAQGIKINKNIDLINIGKGAWSIKSRDFQEPKNNMIGRGLHFNLNGDEDLASDSIHTVPILGSWLKAYSFRLDAYKPGVLTTDISKRITINSAATDGITQKTFITYVPSYDYINAHPDEITEEELIALCNTATDEQLEILAAEGKVKRITQSDRPYYDRPLQIGGLFSVSWKGLVEMDYLKATQGGKIGPFVISDWALYSNNGYLANNLSFYETEQRPIGVYLGRDGLSVRNVFAVYKFPLHPTGIAVGPRGVVPTDGTDGTYDEAGDFVVTTSYTGSLDTRDVVTAAQESQYRYTHDQAFYPKFMDYKLMLQNQQFLLKGNSVIDGKTVLNGNSYIFGRLEVGLSKELSNTDGGSDADYVTHNKVIFYANTKMYGTLNVTGKAYIGDGDARWNEKNLDDVLDTNKASAVVQKFGFIVYRNALLGQNVVIGNNLIVGLAHADAATNKDINFDETSSSKAFITTQDNTVFRSYTANNYFYGNLHAAGNFQAGLYNNQDSKIYLYAFKIHLGRGDIATINAQQSEITIYGNVTQYGSFTAGSIAGSNDMYGGQPITLNGKLAGLIINSDRQGYFKLYAGTVYVEGEAAKPQITLYVNKYNYIDMNGAVNGTGIEIVSSRGITIDVGNNVVFEMSRTSGFKIATSNASITGAITGSINLTGTLEFHQNGRNDGEADMYGNLRVHGNIYAQNINTSSQGASISGGTGGTAGGFGSGGVSGGFGGGMGGTGFGAWQVVGNNLQHVGGDFVLNADDEKISWGSDYIDANGNVSGGSGIQIVSSSVILKGSTVSAGSANDIFYGTSTFLNLKANTGIEKTLYFGANGSNYNIDNQGVAKLKSLTVQSGGSVYIVQGDLHIADGNIYTSKGNIYTSNGNITAGDDAGFKSADGSMWAKSGKIGENFTVSTQGVSITKDKLNYSFTDKNGETHQFSQLGKLAYANDVKKKIKLNDIKITVDGTYYEKVSSGGTVYYTGSSWDGTERYAYYKAGTGSGFSYGSSSSAPKGYSSYFMGYYNISSSGTGATHFKKVDLDQTVDIETIDKVILGPDSGTNDVITLTDSDVTVTYN